MIWNTALLSLRAIRRNLLRSFLTVLGIVIGVGAVIIMVTVGNGATARVKEQISGLGSNLLIVTPGKRMGPGQSTGAGPFKETDAEAIMNSVNSVSAVAPVSSMSTKAIYGNQNWTTQASGSGNEYFKVTKRSLGTGREFTESELRSGAAVCVIGQTVRRKLFDNQPPVGETIRLQKLSCQVIGVMAAKGQNTMGMDQDDLVVVPLRTMQRRIAGNQDVGMIQVSVKESGLMDRGQQDITQLMRERRHLSATDDDNFTVMDTREITKMLTTTTQTLTALLSAVAAVSLLVGGIGIMNIMLVSVTERTREIGVRLAIGALEHEVLLQFLVEAVVLSSLGGLLGVVLALGSCIWLTRLLHVPFIFNGGIVLTAFGFSAAVGVIFGYFPALKAAKLDPIEALRRE
jgi:putative ABC transport system permease protein